MGKKVSREAITRVKLLIDEAHDLILSQVPSNVKVEIDAELQAIRSSFLTEYEAGLKALEADWRAWTASHEQKEVIEATIKLAERARKDFEVCLLLGVGGSDLAPRVLHDCLNDPLHNLLPPEQRGGGLELYFAGNTFDPRRLASILTNLKHRGVLTKTLVNVISRSGSTSETLAALALTQQWLQDAGVKQWRRNVVATTLLTGDKNLLYQMHHDKKHGPFYGLLPIGEGVGGRFSAASPVGLFALALTANDNHTTPRKRVRQAMTGFRRGHEQTFKLSAGHRDNVAFRLARWLHLAEWYAGKTTFVFYDFGDNQHLGDWLTQLYSESVQERGQGLNIITTRGPTGNHSLLNGIIRGPRDKVVVFVRWADLDPAHVSVPKKCDLEGRLAGLKGLEFQDIQTASWKGTAADFTANGIPNVTLVVPRRDEVSLFHLIRILMDTVAVKGRLQGLHRITAGEEALTNDLTYHQDGVEGYKERTRKELERLQKGSKL